MHYVAHLHPNETLFREYDPSLSSPGETAPILRSTPETGSYSLEIQEERAYLRACINPRGPSAITYEQFIQNRYTYDLQFSRLWPVLLGQEPMRDYRCLWTHLSVPADKTAPDSAYQVLEKAWPSWYQWWYAHFPKL
jgi:cyanosortase A-associated protein